MNRDVYVEFFGFYGNREAKLRYCVSNGFTPFIVPS
jgi:hypothetical protein